MRVHEVTVAAVPPKVKLLFPTVVLKPVPAIVTLTPPAALPEFAVTEVMDGV